MRCDEGKPICSTCSTAGLICDEYARSIVFAADDDQSGVTQYRRPLFTDRERQSMSEALQRQVSRKTAHTLLAEIDAEWNITSVSQFDHADIQRGPFGAFRARSIPVEYADSPDVSAFINNFFTDIDDAILSNQGHGQLEAGGESSWLNESEENDIANFLSLQNSVTLEQHVPLDPLSAREFAPAGFHTFSPSSFDRRLTQHQLTTVPFPITQPRVFSTVEILRDAPVLLKHYADVVIPLLTPFQHGKTPWHILFLPLAKATLASLAIGELQDDANLGAFYGTLALSARHLYAACGNRKWSDLADVFGTSAQQHIASTRSHMYELPKAFKYKVVVVALLTVAQLSVAEGRWEQTEYWLLEAEKFIRLRGLQKPQKSRKVRLLHHCYAYMRLFHESLSFTSSSADQRSQIHRAVQENGSLVSGQDHPMFRLTPWANLDDKLREIKSRELGENDLHLASPGLWTSTLYPEIWGIPESWMILLSQSIRLGNEKDLADGSDDTATLSLHEFSRRAKALERCILDWDSAPNGMISAFLSDRQRQTSDVDLDVFKSALQALHHALIIYFYRRTHNLDAHMLQSQVKQVRDSLFICKQHMQSGSRYLAGLVWPAFVAACEAIDPDLQADFVEWFELCAQHNGQYSLTRMREFVKLLWSQREKPNNSSLTWLQLLKDKSAVL